MIKWERTVLPQEAGEKLVVFLAKYLSTQFSARAIKRIVDTQGCEINGKLERFASTLLSAGDYLILYLPEQNIKFSTVFDPSRILFEDEYLLAYNKPAGIASISSDNSSQSYKDMLHIMHTYNQNLILIHRLDKETTGVLLFAKNQNVFQNIVQQFKQLKVQKQYQAIVDGKIVLSKGKIENKLAKIKQQNGQIYWGSVADSNNKGLYASTSWKKEKSSEIATLLTCWPLTGRTHQIRIHLADIGHPILGEKQYANRFCCSYRPESLLLHAEKLICFHPITKQQLLFHAPLPIHFVNAKKKLFL